MKLLYSILGALSLLILSASAKDEVSYLTKMKEVLKSHKAFSYNCQLIETDCDDANESDTTNFECLFKNVPSDTSIGVYYQFKENGIISRIYNGDAIYEYEPKTYGKRIINQILRKNKPEVFSEQEVIMGEKTFYEPSSVKNHFAYWYSPIEFLNDSNLFSRMVLSKDTIISGKLFPLYKYESDGIYMEIAFDTVSCLPVFFQTNQELRHILTESFENYTFIDKNVDVSFIKANFPKGMKFVNNAPMIEKKEKNKLKIGNTVPDFDCKDIFDSVYSLSKLKGRPSIIMFTGIGCAPCYASIPIMNKLCVEYPNVNVVALFPIDNKNNILKYANEQKINYKVLVGNKSIKNDYGISGYPNFIIIDSEGILKDRLDGYSENLEELIKAKLDKVLNN